MTEEKLEKFKKFEGSWEFEMQSDNIEEVLAAQGKFIYQIIKWDACYRWSSLYCLMWDSDLLTIEKMHPTLFYMLLYIGMNWATRKIAKRLTPKIIISFVNSPSDDEKLLRIEYQTVVKNMEQIYKCPGTTQHRGLKSSSCLEFSNKLLGVQNFF